MPINQAALAVANEILKACDTDKQYPTELQLEMRGTRLFITSRYGSTPMLVRRDGCYPTFNYGRYGMGGTQAQALCQLARWIRNQTRVPLGAWRYWCGDTVKLARDNGATVMALLDGSSYPDARYTSCVLCGAPDPRDWWSIRGGGGKTGPCCAYERCRHARCQ